jgi:hypothetical protein
MEFKNYKPKHYSGMPEELKSYDEVEVVFSDSDESWIDIACNFGWNKCDIVKYRKVTK